jgi:hypothetical protein
MTALTWTTLQTELLVALAQGPPPYNVVPPDFASLYPNATSYAESRICAEIPLLANRAENSALQTVSGSRRLNLSLMTNPLVVMEGLALLTPNTVSAPALGTRNIFDQATVEFIDQFWPVEATTLNPSLADNVGRYWAPMNTGPVSTIQIGGVAATSTVVIAPTPDATYTAVCTGLFQPVPLSAGNPSTYLSSVYPDLLVAACMVFLEGTLKRNFGAQSDDPRQALSWEAIYTQLRDACAFEEARRRGLSPDIPKAAAPAQAA